MGNRRSRLSSAAEAATDEVPIMVEGQLMKPRRHMGGWTSRWFIALETGVLLSCKQASGYPAGVMRSIKPVHQMLRGSTVSLTRWEDNDWPTFEVHTGSRTLHLRAESEAQRTRWLGQLRELALRLPAAAEDVATDRLVLSSTRRNIMALRRRDPLPASSPEKGQGQAGQGGDDSELTASELQQKLLQKTGHPVRIVRYESGVDVGGEIERTPVQTTLRHRLVAAIHQAVPDMGVAVLVLDDAATRVLSSACRMSALYDAGVGVVESLERSREPVGLDVVYLISPSYRRPGGASSMDRVLADYSRPKGKGPLYEGNATILLLNRPDDEDEDGVLALIEACRPLAERLRTGPISLSCGFLAPEPHLFLLDLPRCFGHLYAPEPNAYRGPAIAVIAARMVQACLALNEYPYIRFPAGNPIAGRIAALVQDGLDCEVRANAAFWYHGMTDAAQRCTLLVTERCEDLATPLVHEFSLQAMAFDLLADRLDGDVLMLPNGQQVPLSYFNKAFRHHRHSHIHDVAATVMTQVEELKLNPAARLQARPTDYGESDLTLAEVAEGVAQLGDYQKLSARLSQVSQVSQMCMQELQRRNLVEVAEWEQALLTGVDMEGAAAKPKALRQELNSLLQSVEEGEALRLLALHVVAGESHDLGTPEERRQLLAAAALAPPGSPRAAVSDSGSPVPPRPPCGDDVLINLVTLMEQGLMGAPPEEESARDRKRRLKRAQADVRARHNLQELLSRYEPPLKQVVRSCLLPGSTPEDEESLEARFPFIVAPPPGQGRRSRPPAKSARSIPRRRSSSSSSLSCSSGEDSEPEDGETVLEGKGARFIVFVAGGASYSEARAICELGQEFQRDVLLGATSMMAGDDLLREVGSW